LQEKKTLAALAPTSEEDLPAGKAIEAKYREVAGNDLEPKAPVETLSNAAKKPSPSRKKQRVVGMIPSPVRKRGF